MKIVNIETNDRRDVTEKQYASMDQNVWKEYKFEEVVKTEEEFAKELNELKNMQEEEVVKQKRVRKNK